MNDVYQIVLNHFMSNPRLIELVWSHCSATDLITCNLVCKRFHLYMLSMIIKNSQSITIPRMMKLYINNHINNHLNTRYMIIDITKSNDFSSYKLSHRETSYESIIKLFVILWFVYVFYNLYF